MAEYLIELIATVVQNSIIIHFMTEYLGTIKKCTKKHILLFIFILTVEASIINSKFAVGGISIIVPIITILVISHLYLNGAPYKKFFSCLFIVTLMAGTGASTAALICSIFNTNISKIITRITKERLLLLVTANILFLSLSKLIIRFSRKDIDKNRKGHIFGLLIPLFSLIIVYTLMEFVMHYIDARTGYAFFALLAIAALLINLFAYCIYMALLKEQKANYQKSLQVQAYEYQMNNHKNLIQIYQDTIRLRHDMKHQFALIQSLLKSGHIADAESYISSLIDINLEHSPILLCDNEIINYVLNFKMTQCKKLSISCSFQITAPLSNLAEPDLILILSNLLDNAIEAEKKLTAPDIKVLIQRQGGYINFTIKNRIDQSVLERNPSLKTTKKDSGLHGYGIPSARDLLSQHGGMLDFYESYGYFICRVLFPFYVTSTQPVTKNDKVCQAD